MQWSSYLLSINETASHWQPKHIEDRLESDGLCIVTNFYAYCYVFVINKHGVRKFTC